MKWNSIETFFLDMDGTLLDLAYDNYFWHEHIPAVYSKKTTYLSKKPNVYLKKCTQIKKIQLNGIA